MTRPDKFLDPYMGKDYSNRAGLISGTEILTKGFEMLYNNPEELAEGDPDMFDFLWRILRGPRPQKP